jgi:predicted transglutaminase-like cysteine proteinase
MTLRLKTLKLALLTLIASLGLCTLADKALVKERNVTFQNVVSEPVNEPLVASLNHRPVTPFAISAVLAKFDRAQARGPVGVHLASLVSTTSATDAPPLPISGEPFGLFSSPAPEDAPWRKWRGVEADMAAEQIIMDRCRTDPQDCPPYAAQFLRLIDAVKAKSGRAELDETNRAVNASIRYVSDLTQFGEVDRWSAPLATFATAQGDCEDYAIAKYVALQQAGFPPDDLQLVLVRDRAAWQDHAVLLARIDRHWLILDNRYSELLEDVDAVILTPLYAIDHHGVRLLAGTEARQTRDDGAEAAHTAAGPDDAMEWGGVLRTP